MDKLSHKRRLTMLIDFYHFFQDRDAPAQPISQHFQCAVIIVVTYFKNNLKRRGNASIQGQTKERQPFLTLLLSVYLKCHCRGGERVEEMPLRKECAVNATLMAKLVRLAEGIPPGVASTVCPLQTHSSLHYFHMRRIFLLTWTGKYTFLKHK